MRRVNWLTWSRRPDVRAAVGVLLLLAISLSPVSLSPIGLGPAKDRAGAAISLPLPNNATNFRILEPDYMLSADRRTGVVSVGTPAGRLRTSFPLSVLAGRARFPSASRVTVTEAASGLVVRVVDQHGSTLSSGVLSAHPHFFTVAFSGQVGPNPTLGRTRFFSNGSRGLDGRTIVTGFNTDPESPRVDRYPNINSAKRTPLAPPPLDLVFDTSSGWMGFGLVQVPSATAMSAEPDGSISVNYHLTDLLRYPDQGSGGAIAGSRMVAFPSFAMTFGDGDLNALRAYRDALDSLGAAATPAANAWWWGEPITDTWGQQVEDGCVRANPCFTAGWVRHFVDRWRSIGGLNNFTVIIDARWQGDVGIAEPDPTRFGGYAGMRQLVDSLHTDGVHVLLWWPIWGQPPSVCRSKSPDLQDICGSGRPLADPTSPSFEPDMTDKVTRMLGSGRVTSTPMA